MSGPTRSWKDVLSDKPVNEARPAVYERLKAGRSGSRRRAIGPASIAAIRSAVDWADEELSDDDRREDRYLASLAHLRALGGGRRSVIRPP